MDVEMRREIDDVDVDGVDVGVVVRNYQVR